MKQQTRSIWEYNCVRTANLRNLHGPCNILIALNAFGDIFRQLAHIPLAYYTFTGNTYAPLKTCLIIQFVPNFFMNFSMFLLLMIGIDRFISIKCLLSFLDCSVLLPLKILREPKHYQAFTCRTHLL
ncbi:unnamed protein product [Gongylonema pulchrum]|uniref:G_PROTEIN_RECEP_F1_2 domain-containing protein n=1 Tax=Gongylonema pulchrum TaxID=637853 RepID=A0A183DSE3_9BILA|nr:unnamed protein product [Gongylonema pulchrum]